MSSTSAVFSLRVCIMPALVFMLRKMKNVGNNQIFKLRGKDQNSGVWKAEGEEQRGGRGAESRAWR